MALDFAVLATDGASADIVPLEWHQHGMLMILAEQFNLSLLLRCEDYFEEVDFTPNVLPALSEELGLIRKAAPPADIAKFLHDLDALISLAVRRKQLLTAVPD